MITKKAYTLQELILYLEALEMLDMVYKVEKFPEWNDPDTGESIRGVWLIEYQQGEPILEPAAILFED